MTVYIRFFCFIIPVLVLLYGSYFLLSNSMVPAAWRQETGEPASRQPGPCGAGACIE